MQMFLNVASLACCGVVSRLPVDRCLGWLVVSYVEYVIISILNNFNCTVLTESVIKHILLNQLSTRLDSLVGNIS